MRYFTERFCEHSNESSYLVNGHIFLVRLHDCQSIKKDSAPFTLLEENLGIWAQIRRLNLLNTDVCWSVQFTCRYFACTVFTKGQGLSPLSSAVGCPWLGGEVRLGISTGLSQRPLPTYGYRFLMTKVGKRMRLLCDVSE